MVPCYNEAAIIGRSYERIKEILVRRNDPHEIIVANDGSTDDSRPILKQIEEKDPDFVLIDYSPNRGMGYACRQMFERARGDVLVEMDADLSMDPADTIPLFTRHLAQYDCVVGSRYKGIAADYPLRRRVASRGYYLLNQLLFSLPLRDTQSGFFGIRRALLSSLNLQCEGFELHVELFAQMVLKGYSILEVPVRFVHQTESGEVSVLRAAPKMFFNTLKLYQRLKRSSR